MLMSDLYGSMVFDDRVMSKRLPKDTYRELKRCCALDLPLSRETANIVANEMKDWAVEKGVTHFTHWFQPLTGITAEKHDSFIAPTKNGGVIMELSGKELIKGEPDASSFPSGGLRSTFEARGYTAWDPTSYAFIKDGILCIPTAFCSYNGDALDKKTPLLRSMEAINRQGTRLLAILGKKTERINVSVGPEQEYFLIDTAMYEKRKDLFYTGRTLFGARPPKGQELSDHYFGAIPSRVEAFMKDFETEAYKLGIQLQTRHNEVAPNQFECAPVFCEATKAIDQNMLLMIVMPKVAEKHHLKVIFHEKPFDGINGSGKHCNWSMQTDTGVNLLSPGKTPTKNLQFLAFYSAVVRAVYRHNYLLMTSVCTLNNSYRLGGHEAPPAVMSIFSGSTLSRIFDSILNMTDFSDAEASKASIQMVSSIPEIVQDNTDRNRTSPFAFTGNRFEFRAVGSSANGASATYVLNSIVAESLNEFRKEAEELESKGETRQSAILTVVRKFIAESKDIMFEGNGYSKEWQEEAARRGLRAVRNVPEAYKVFLEKDSIDMFAKLGVLSPVESEARYEVLNETYVKKLQIEARILGDVCLNHIIPAAVSYQNILVKSIQGCKDVFGDEFKKLCKADMDTYKKISGFVNNISADVEALVEARKRANRVEDMAERAYLYSTEVKAEMDKVRYSADHLEMLVDDELWPLPKYRELLFF